MTTATLEAKWIFEKPLHVGTGLSAAGRADRIVRMDGSGRPYLPGDAVKGAVRLSAERLCRWYANGMRKEVNESSQPQHPVIERIFAQGAERGRAQYRFGAGVCAAGKLVRSASTAIGEGGVAKQDTLRVVENWAGGVTFEITIRAAGGDFENKASEDWKDFQVLGVALLLTEAVGGKRTSGLGRVKLEKLSYRLGGAEAREVDGETAARWAEAAIERIQAAGEQQ